MNLQVEATKIILTACFSNFSLRKQKFAENRQAEVQEEK
jgi:hypothetical protein